MVLPRIKQVLWQENADGERGGCGERADGHWRDRSVAEIASERRGRRYGRGSEQVLGRVPEPELITRVDAILIVVVEAERGDRLAEAVEANANDFSAIVSECASAA